MRAAAPEIDEEADEQVGTSDGILIQHQSVEGNLADDDRNRHLHRSALADHITRVVPRADAGQVHGHFHGMRDRDSLDAFEDIANPHTGIRAGASRGDVKGFDARRAINPNHTIVRQTET